MDHKNIDPEVILGDYDPEVLTGEGQLGMSDATDDAPTDWRVVGPAAALVLAVIPVSYTHLTLPTKRIV